MTSETPCLPECGCVCGHDNDWHSLAVGVCRSREHCNCALFVARAHAPNCPNAKPAEPDHPFAAGAFNLCVHKTGMDTSTRCNRPKSAHKPAEPPACFCRGRAVLGPVPQDGSDAEVQYTHATGCPKDAGPSSPEPQSEPPQVDGGYDPERHDPVLVAIRLDAENISLKAERDALLGKAAALELELKASDDSRWSSTHNLTVANEQIAGLKVRVEELSESLLWATSSYEERVVILANREKRKEQEASKWQVTPSMK